MKKSFRVLFYVLFVVIAFAVFGLETASNQFVFNQQLYVYDYSSEESDWYIHYVNGKPTNEKVDFRQDGQPTKFLIVDNNHCELVAFGDLLSH